MLLVFVERIAQGAYNLAAVQTESTQIKNVIGGEFVEPTGFLVIPSEVEEWSEWDERHRRLRREGSGERVGRRPSQSLDLFGYEFL